VIDSPLLAVSVSSKVFTSFLLELPEHANLIIASISINTAISEPKNALYLG